MSFIILIPGMFLIFAGAIGFWEILEHLIYKEHRDDKAKEEDM
jgi:hypothetical protein